MQKMVYRHSIFPYGILLSLCSDKNPLYCIAVGDINNRAQQRSCGAWSRFGQKKFDADVPPVTRHNGRIPSAFRGKSGVKNETTCQVQDGFRKTACSGMNSESGTIQISSLLNPDKRPYYICILNRILLHILIIVLLIFSFFVSAQNKKNFGSKQKKEEKVLKQQLKEKFAKITGVKLNLQTSSSNIFVTLVGISPTKIMVLKNGRRYIIPFKKIIYVDFYTDIKWYKIDELISQDKLEKAANIICAKFIAFADIGCLEIPHNNAFSALFTAADLYFKTGKNLLYSNHKKGARHLFKKAFNVYKKLSKIKWTRERENAKYKAIISLLYIGRYKKVAKIMTKIKEPEKHNSFSYAAYCYIKAKLLMHEKKWRKALDRITQTVVFMSKSLDLFPSALMMCAECYEEILNFYRARDIYYAVAYLFYQLPEGKEAFKRLKYIYDRGFVAKKEPVDIAKVFFGETEDIDKKVRKFFKLYKTLKK